MAMILTVGDSLNGGEIELDLASVGLMMLTGVTGSGKGVFHFRAYKQLIEKNDPQKLGFVFLDMTRVDFTHWLEEYLYRPTIAGDLALSVMEELADESEKRASGELDKSRFVVVHVEECDLMAQYPDRFEKALLTFANNAGKSNMTVVFSTSRPSVNVFTPEIVQAAQSKIVFELASPLDYKTVLQDNFSEDFGRLSNYQFLLEKDGEIQWLDSMPSDEAESVLAWAENLGA